MHTALIFLLVLILLSNLLILVVLSLFFSLLDVLSICIRLLCSIPGRHPMSAAHRELALLMRQQASTELHSLFFLLCVALLVLGCKLSKFLQQPGSASSNHRQQGCDSKREASLSPCGPPLVSPPTSCPAPFRSRTLPTATQQMSGTELGATMCKLHHTGKDSRHTD